MIVMYSLKSITARIEDNIKRLNEPHFINRKDNSPALTLDHSFLSIL